MRWSVSKADNSTAINSLFRCALCCSHHCWNTFGRMIISSRISYLLFLVSVEQPHPVAGVGTKWKCQRAPNHTTYNERHEQVVWWRKEMKCITWQRGERVEWRECAFPFRVIDACHSHYTIKCNTKRYYTKFYRLSERRVNGQSVALLTWMRSGEFDTTNFFYLIHSFCHCALILRNEYGPYVLSAPFHLDISTHFNLITISIIVDAAMHSNHTTDLLRSSLLGIFTIRYSRLFIILSMLVASPAHRPLVGFPFGTISKSVHSTQQ